MEVFKNLSRLLIIFSLSVSFFIGTPVKADEFKWLLCQSIYDKSAWSCNSSGGVLSGKDCSIVKYDTQAACEIELNKKNPSNPLAPSVPTTPSPKPASDSSGQKPPATTGGPVDEVRCICEDPKGKSVCIYDLAPKVYTVELESDCAAKIDKNHKNCKIESGNCKDYNSGGKFNLDSLKVEAKQKLNPVGFLTGKAGMLQLMGQAINFLIFPIGAFAMIMYIWAGFLWMSGNADNITKAKSILVWTTLGIIFSLSSYLLVNFVFSNLFA